MTKAHIAKAEIDFETGTVIVYEDTTRCRDQKTGRFVKRPEQDVTS